MRPLVLNMTAFGPYVRPQQIDFRLLGERSFFLIHGPTGAGKTTVLDALCFALYGDASGWRDSRSLRSDYAAPDQLTEVTLEFALGRQAYRVHRLPEQQRPKKRGSGVTTLPAEAELYHIQEAGSILIASGWQEVTRRIETLLGFKSSQFRQVVLLPQGEFRKLLAANSAERQEILQVLFRTERYQAFEEFLKEQAGQLKKGYESGRQQIEWLLAESGVAQAAELSEQAAAHRVAWQAARAAAEAAAERLTAAHTARQQALDAAAKLQEENEARLAWQALQAQQPAQIAAEARYRQAQRAAALAGGERLVAEWTEQETAAQTALAAANALLQRDQQRAAAAEQEYAVAAATEPERAAAAAAVREWQAMAVKWQAVEAAAQDIAQAAAAQQAAAERVLAQQHTAEAQRQQLLACQQARQAALLSGNEAVLREKEYTALQQAWEQWQQCAAWRKEAAALAAECRQAEGGVTERQQRQQTAAEQLAALQDAWLAGQAAVLAGELQAGQACPVCGSAHHPQPAVAAVSVEQGELKAAQQRLRQADADLDTARQQLLECRSRQAAKDAQVQAATTALGEQAAWSQDAWQTALTAAAAAYQAAQAAQQEAVRLEAAERQLETTLQQAQADMEAAQQEQQAASLREETARAIWQERAQAIPAELAHPGSIDERLEAATAAAAQLSAAWETVQQEHAASRQQLARSEAAAQAAAAQLAQAAERRRAETAAWRTALQQAGFPDAAAYQAACLSETALAALEAELQAFRQAWAAAEARWQRATAQATGLTAPDMASVEAAVTAAAAAQTELLAEATRLEACVEQESAWLAKLETLQAGLETLEARYAVIGRLAEVANGGNAHKLTLQRFVLGALLDDVAVAANQRLKQMSRGRYQLQRTLDRARKNAAGGLDLEVFDQYTGQARAVSTLSGGETFLASLALALGLADVVQAYAGGIHLEAIFVDEGFGTLDPEALEAAMDALTTLNEGGRLVGIISHVPELRERIDTRLTVTPGERGSSVGFQFGS